LVVSDESDLTRWVKVDNDETRRAVELDRLCMYPILLSDNLSMGFARVGKTRITYIRDAVTWVGRNLKIDDLVIRAEITFPRKNVKDRNIIVRFREKGLSCDADLLFTGDNLICTRKTYNLKQSSNTDSADKFRRKVEKNILDSPERLKAFYAKFMVNFKYKSLGRESKNIRHYLKGNSYRISIIEFADIPILSLEKWS